MVRRIRLLCFQSYICKNGANVIESKIWHFSAPVFVGDKYRIFENNYPLNNYPSRLTPPSRHQHRKNYSLRQTTSRYLITLSLILWPKRLTLPSFNLNFILSEAKRSHWKITPVLNNSPSWLTPPQDVVFKITPPPPTRSYSRKYGKKVDFMIKTGQKCPTECNTRYSVLNWHCAVVQKLPNNQEIIRVKDFHVHRTRKSGLFCQYIFYKDGQIANRS